MSYSRVMPTIKPYPHQDIMYDMSYPQPQTQIQPQYQQLQQRQQQQQSHYSVYRPAYHRIPSTPAIAPRQSSKDVWASMSPEVSPIVVPSMSTASVDFYQTAVSNYGYPTYYRQPIVQSNSNYHHQTTTTTTTTTAAAATTTTTTMQHIPIHHTLENATITYDTVVPQDFQKDLVKDVFFSPAMIQGDREMSPSNESSCGSSTSDENEESDYSISSTPFSPHETPSDLLMLDENVHLFDFGLDLATTTNNTTTTSSYEEVIMMATTTTTTTTTKKKPDFNLSLKKNMFDFDQFDLLPTPPADTMKNNKRRSSDSVLQDRIKKKKQRQESVGHLRSFHTTPPASPCLLSALKNETIFESNCDYFEDASGEESSDDDDHYTQRSSLEYSRFDHLSTATDSANAPQSQTVTLSDDDEEEEEDSFSTTSWEEEEEVVSDTESVVTEEEEGDEEFKAPVKYTPKKKTFSSVHPLLCLGKKDQTTVVSQSEELIIEESDKTTTISPRPTSSPTIYQKLTKASIDWCRYCGTTEGVNWRPGPWGKRTLCNKHGCDYKGYGFACKLPRLDLTGFTRESIDDRDRPVLQLYCSGCQRKESWESNVLVRCEGCPKAFHQKCCPTELSDAFVESKEAWFCDANCCENTRRKRIVVELPRKRLPLMCAPKSNSSSSSASSVSSESSTTSRARALRESSISSTR